MIANAGYDREKQKPSNVFDQGGDDVPADNQILKMQTEETAQLVTKIKRMPSLQDPNKEAYDDDMNVPKNEEDEGLIKMPPSAVMKPTLMAPMPKGPVSSMVEDPSSMII